MKKLMKRGSLVLLAVVLLIPGYFWMTGPVYAQGQSKQLTDEQYQKLQQKRQEQWQTQEDIQKSQEPGERLKSGVKHRDDALKRQKAAEQKLKELEK